VITHEDADPICQPPDTYLIAIASHSVVARFEDKELKRIERVLAIPLVYQKAHELVKNELNSNRPRITQTLSTLSASTSNNSIATANTSNDDLSSETDELPPEADEDLPPDAPPSASSSPSLSSSVEEGFQKIVEPNKINFSRLLWKPKPMLSGHQEPSSSSTSTSTAQPPQSTMSNRSRSTSKAAEEAPPANQEGRLSLDKKFVAVLSDELTRGGMFYALDWDITHSFQSKADQCSPDETVSNLDSAYLLPLCLILSIFCFVSGAQNSRAASQASSVAFLVEPTNDSTFHQKWGLYPFLSRIRLEILLQKLSKLIFF
jgi:hypothetical protein